MLRMSLQLRLYSIAVSRSRPTTPAEGKSLPLRVYWPVKGLCLGAESLGLRLLDLDTSPT